jgi:tetratricopeptide (TPR) repeat protein
LSLKDDPDDYELYFYFNQVYALQRDSKTSVEWGEKYIKKYEEGKIGRFNHTIFFTMFRSYQALNNVIAATKIIKKGLDICPDDMDLNVALLELGIWTNNHIMVEKGSENYIRLYNKFNGNPEAIVQNKFLLSNNPKTYTFCKQNIASIRLQQGIGHLKDIKIILANLNEDKFKNLVNKNIFKLLDAVGCPELRTILQPTMVEIQDIH